MTEKNARFWTFLKLWVGFVAILGFIGGIVSLANAVTGGNTTATFFSSRFDGVLAGLINLVWIPILSSAAATVSSLIVYMPFRWALMLAGAAVIETEAHRDATDA